MAEYCSFMCITYTWKLKKPDTEKKWWLPGVEGGRNREILAKGYEFPVIKYVS